MKNDLGKDKISKLVFAIAIPSMIAQIVNVLYSVIDRIYIGHLQDAGSLALAGVGVCGPILTMIAALGSLVGVGGGALCAIKLGEKKEDVARDIISSSFILLLIISIIIPPIIIYFQEHILLLFGASEATLPYAISYFKVYLLGTPFALLTIGMNNFINCQGYSKMAMVTTLIGTFINIILDPILMFKFNMGVTGAALASIIGQFVSCVFVLYILMSKKLEISLRIKKLNLKLSSEVLTIGFNQFIIVMFDNVMIIALNSLLKKYGAQEADTYIAINTIIQSFMLIVTMPLGGISGGTQCILSYNYGAYNVDRVKEAFYYLMKVCACYCTIMFVAVYLFGNGFITLFTKDLYLKEMTFKALKIYTLFIIPLGFQYEMVDGMTALGQVKISLFLSFFRKSVYFIMLFILPLFFSPIYIFASESISDILAPIVSYLVVKHNFDKIMEWRLYCRTN